MGQIQQPRHALGQRSSSSQSSQTRARRSPPIAASTPAKRTRKSAAPTGIGSNVSAKHHFLFGVNQLHVQHAVACGAE